LPGDEERLVVLWERLVAVLGVRTVRVLLDRAIWQTATRHPALTLLHHDEAGLSFDAVEQSYATRPQQEIETALSDLMAGLRLILTHLLGREVVP
jgi:hypothetical protein